MVEAFYLTLHLSRQANLGSFVQFSNNTMAFKSRARLSWTR